MFSSKGWDEYNRSLLVVILIYGACAFAAGYVTAAWVVPWAQENTHISIGAPDGTGSDTE